MDIVQFDGMSHQAIHIQRESNKCLVLRSWKNDKNNFSFHYVEFFSVEKEVEERN
jgi:hypothetical protein